MPGVVEGRVDPAGAPVVVAEVVVVVGAEQHGADEQLTEVRVADTKIGGAHSVQLGASVPFPADLPSCAPAVGNSCDSRVAYLIRFLKSSEFMA